MGLLKVPFPIKATSFKKDKVSGRVTELHATYEKPDEGNASKKPKTYIQWVGKSGKHGSPVKAEARIFSPLFKSEIPDSVEGGFLQDLTENSEAIFSNAMIETGLAETRRRAPWPQEAGEQNLERGKLSTKQSSGPKTPGFEIVRFQGLRIAYFCMDKDSEGDKIILNKTVSLKEDADKAT